MKKNMRVSGEGKRGVPALTRDLKHCPAAVATKKDRLSNGIFTKLGKSFKPEHFGTKRPEKMQPLGPIILWTKEDILTRDQNEGEEKRESRRKKGCSIHHNRAGPQKMKNGIF